jgi:transposase
MIITNTDRHAIGIDISKDFLDGFDSRSGKAFRFPNKPVAIAAFLKKRVNGSLIVIEATAPYDLALRRLAARQDCPLVRVNPGRARDFARASGQLAKTDTIDARVLALMALKLGLVPDPPHDEAREALAALHRRRDQLVDMRAAEWNRSAAADAHEKRSVARHILWLSGEIAAIEAKLKRAVADPAVAGKAAIMRSFKGVGEVTTATLLALCPELGHRSHKEIAALVGLAPINCDSGKFRGQRRTGHGRRRVRRALYMAALAAIRTTPKFRDVYNRIKLRSGHAKVAVCAVARKIIVILNAMLRDNVPYHA